jgi:uncharacterized protein with PIN domain
MKFKEPVTAGEAIQTIRIPLAEVDLVTIGGNPVPRAYRLIDGDLVSVYPAFETFDISNLRTAQGKPLRTTRFILDAHLGKLAKYLRMLGFDSLYRNDFGDEEIIEMALAQGRIILTRDRLLLRSPRITHGYYVRSVEKQCQLNEIVKKYDLYSQFRTFSRCMVCNTELQLRDREFVRGRVEADVYQRFSEFSYCPECDKVFWKGSHFDRMERLILGIVTQPEKDQGRAGIKEKGKAV